MVGSWEHIITNTWLCFYKEAAYVSGADKTTGDQLFVAQAGDTRGRRAQVLRVAHTTTIVSSVTDMELVDLDFSLLGFRFAFARSSLLFSYFSFGYGNVYVWSLCLGYCTFAYILVCKTVHYGKVVCSIQYSKMLYRFLV
jgi:hypothetical protein